MDNEDVMNATLNEVDELYHYGVPGMKWGVRRSPAQLGHPAGSKKRRSKAKKYIENLMKQHKAKKEAKKAAEEERKRDLEKMNKPVSKMSDAELAQYIARKSAERTAYSLERDIKTLQPEKVSAGKKFLDAFRDKAMASVVDASGKMMNNLMNQAVEKALGKGAVDPLAALKKEAEKAGYAQIISNAKNAHEKAKYQEYITREKVDKYNADKAAREAESTKASKSSGNDSSKVYEGTVEWGDFKKATSSQQKAGKTVVDAESWSTTPASSTSSSTRQLGQSYIAGLLPPPKDDD